MTTDRYLSEGVETTVTLNDDHTYVEVISYIDDVRRYRWSEPTAAEMRDMVDHILRGRTQRRAGRRYEHRRIGGARVVTGSVWRYDLTPG